MFLKVEEREGFEPSIRITYTHFPGVRLKPLGHLSNYDLITTINIEIPQDKKRVIFKFNRQLFPI